MSVEGGRKAWNLLPTDRHPADDLVVLAAMSLITLSKFNDQDSDELLSKPNSFNILQATALLEYAASFSESNFQIRLLLVRLYQYLGDGLHAMWAFDHLALKQIQLDTLSYVMLDGISSLHPHGFCTSGETHIKAPVEQFKKQQKMIRGAFGHINRNTWLSYKHGSYNTVFELQEVSDKLGYTLASVMSVVETMRINRLIPSGEPTNCGLDILRRSSDITGYDYLINDFQAANFDSADSNISDTNDYSTFPNFETSLGASFEELSRHKPGPNVDIETKSPIMVIANERRKHELVSMSTINIWQNFCFNPPML
jgi:N-terminal acetyltransferase B complex non-catalytic subunit